MPLDVAKNANFLSSMSGIQIELIFNIDIVNINILLIKIFICIPAQPCEDYMLVWHNLISHGNYVAIDSSLLSGQGSAFQQCADYCYSLEG